MSYFRLQRTHLQLLMVLGVLFAVFAFGWFTRGLARAYLETKHAHIFATQVSAVGWELPDHALVLDLPADAPYASFTKDNSAYVSIGTTTEPVASAPAQLRPVDATSTPQSDAGTGTALGTDAEAGDIVPVDTADDSDTASSSPPQSDADQPDEVLAPADAPQDSGTDANNPAPDAPADESASSTDPVSLIDVARKALVGFMPRIGIAQATTTGTSTSDVSVITSPAASTTSPALVATTTGTSTTTAPVAQPAAQAPVATDVVACAILGNPCYYAQLSGFAVAGSLTDKKFKEASVSFSFGSRAPEGGIGDDTLVVRYYHAGQWRQAGEIFLNKELSNESNGDYFTASLDDISAWDDLSDVHVLIEYERGDGEKPVRLFLDALWLDVTYQDRAQEVLLGDAPAPGDAPANVSFADLSASSDKPRQLLLDDGGQISFPYAGEEGVLVFRTDRRSYSATPATSTRSTAYLSITNTSDVEQAFKLVGAFPDGSGLRSIEQYLRNVPQESRAPVVRDVTYLCEGGWVEASNTGAFTCAVTAESRTCASLSETGENCTVRDVQVSTTTDVQYVNAWVPLGVSTAAPGVPNLPEGYIPRAVTQAVLSVLPGQTIYLRLSLMAEHEVGARFVIAADGGQGKLDASGLRSENGASASRLNDQLSTRDSFEGDELPQFKFRFKSQASLARKAFNALTGRSNAFKVTDATFVDTAGEREKLPVAVEYGENGEWTLALKEKPRSFRPGKYSVELTVDEGGATFTDSVDFYWGVLVLNADKSTYAPGETVRFGIGVLDDTGDTVCDASLALSVTGPSGATADVPVSPSGQCALNNVVDIADYLASYTTAAPGIYSVQLQHLNEAGQIVHAIVEKFTVTDSAPFTVTRTGATRIYPVASYRMNLSVTAARDFTGTFVETMPKDFQVLESGGGKSSVYAGAKHLSWDIALKAGETREFSYTYDAPDISPYIYLLGPSEIHADGKTYSEGRQWKLASDATGNLLIYWDNTSYIPAGWTCVSCTGGDPFYQVFILGSTTPGLTGGAATHTHTASATVNGDTGSGGAGTGGGGADSALLGHTHTLTPTIGTGSNVPPYRSLMVLEYNSTGEPTQLPAGAILMFDATVPAGWTQYSAQNGYFVRGDSAANIGTTGGSATHTHTLTGTTGGPSATTNANNTNNISIANQNHTHTISSNTASITVLPPYIGTIYGKLTATSSPSKDAIGMWTGDPDALWTSVSGASGAFENRFAVASTTYGNPGGTETHTHANVTNIVSSGPSATNNRGNNAANADSLGSHTHLVDVTSFSTANNMPPYRTAVFAKRGASPASIPTFFGIPFDNEKTGSSTPALEFVSTDPDGTDDLVYEVQWATDATFASTLGDHTSDDESGCSPNCFENLTTPADTSPFTEGEHIRFRIQSALTDGVTYYWRVRAKTNSGGVWGDWGAVQSFTYDSSVNTSQWYQTEDEQFDTGTLTSAQTTGSGSVQPVTGSGSFDQTDTFNAYTTDLDCTQRPTFGNWTAQNGSDGNDGWTTDTNTTASTGTGPASVYDGAYLYLESSASSQTCGANVSFGSSQYVESNTLDGSTYALSFEFMYNMTGAAMDTGPASLHVDAWNGSSWDLDVSGGAINSGQQTAWTSSGVIDLSSYTNSDLKVRIRYILSTGGSVFQNDVAVDDLHIYGDERATYGTIMSPEIDFASVPDQNTWGGVRWSTTEPSGTDVKLHVYYTSSTACDTIIPDGALAGNSTGFDVSAVPLDISGLSTTTYDRICLSADLDAGTSLDPPTLDDWTVKWTLDPAFTQNYYRWYANTDAATPTDPWPSGGTDLAENAPITNSIAVKSSDALRLRMSLNVSSVAASVGANSFKLQYAEGVMEEGNETCTAWQDVGDSASTTALWRGYDNASVSDGATLSSTLLSVSDTAETYVEEASASTANAIAIGDDGEWDWVLEDNGASPGTHYCFRMVFASGTTFLGYDYYPQLVTNGAPTPVQSKLFDNEKTASTTPWFEFAGTDTQGEDLHYQVQVSTSKTFSSTVIDKNTVSNFTQFENVDTPADKAPYTSGETVRFVPTTSLSNGTTYWWRVRSKDPSGSNEWGDWSDTWSFTVDTAVQYTTWFQTLDDQFARDTLTNTSTTSDSVHLSATVSLPVLQSGWTSNTAVPGGTVTLTRPSGVAAGDLLLIFVGNDDNTGTVQWDNSSLKPTGFELINEAGNATPDTHTAAFYRIADGSENPTIDVPAQNTGADLYGFYLRVTGTDQTTPVTVIGTAYAVNNLSNHPITSITTTEPYSLAFYLLSGDGGDTYPYSVSGTGWAQQDQIQAGTGAGNTGGTWGTRDMVSTGATGNATVSMNANDGASGFQFAVNPLAASGVVTSPEIDFDWSTNGNSWGSLSWNDDGVAGNILYHIEYLTSGGTWELIPDSALSGNAAGFDTSPVSLVNLSEVTYSKIRLRANIQQVSGTPSLNDWTLSWGSRVETPTQTKLFDNEKTGTTTPSLEFYTTDPQGDDLTYEVSWSEDATFAASTTKISDTHAGFENATLGSDTQPFNSGDTIRFTVQNADALTNGHTYWWRVRAKDPAGGNNWSPWSPARSFTVDTAITVSTWFQTTDEQFDTDVLAGVQSTGSDSASVGGGAPFDQTDTFNQYTSDLDCSQRPTFGNWTSQNGSDGTNGWTTDINTTASGGTGPSAAYDGAYIYLESSATSQTCGASATLGSSQYLESNVIDASAYAVSFDFVYNMTGTAMDTGPASLHVDAWNGSSWDLDVTGSAINSGQQTAWTSSGAIDLSSYTNSDFKVRIRYIMSNGGSSFQNDVALDDLHLYGDARAVASGTITSTAINFSDGSGPYWQDASWSITNPGSSSSTVQVLYDDGSDYVLIPDSALPSNSTGLSSPVDLTGLNKNTYNSLKLKAALHCNGTDCPTLSDWTLTWSAGLTISGIAKQFDESTNVTSGTVAVAVNGVLQSTKTGTISAGTWSIANVTVFEGDVVTVFIDGAGDDQEAVAVTKYDGIGTITGMALYERHLTLGSDDHPLISNADIGQFDNSVSGDEDVFDDVDGNDDLAVCATTGCFLSKLSVLSGTTYEPDSGSSGNVAVRDFTNHGVFIADGNTISISGSWRNDGNFVAGSSAVVFSATSTTETIDSSGATSTAFSTVTFGSGSGSATWNLGSALYASSTLSVNYGTLSQNGAHAMNLSGSLAIGASGLFAKGSASTTFMGSGSSNWTDSSASKQDMGTVVIDGSTKTVVMGSDVKATDVTIGTDDTLSAGVNRAIEVRGNWTNRNTFNAQGGTVNFTATSVGHIIAPGSSSFYNLTFDGAGGNWSFATTTITIGNNFTIATGTVTLASATTTVAGSFDNSGGAFMHNNGVLNLTTGAAGKSIRLNGSNLYDLAFNGSGSWSFLDTNATSSRQVRIQSGTVTLPAGTFAIGGSFYKNGGSFNANGGTLRFYASSAQTVKLGGTSAANVTFDGVGGSWAFGTTAATTTGSVRFDNGTVTLPSGSLAVGGSFAVTSGSFVHNNGLVRFTATATGNTINPGLSPFYDLSFASATGGWSIVENATSTHDTSITSAGSFTLSSGKTLEVGGTFSNLVGGASTTWTGSTLYLDSGTAYSLNAKTTTGDTYGTLALGPGTHAKMWNSAVTAAVIDPTASLYSQDDAGADGALYIWGAYSNSGNEYWSYSTDFDGASLGSPRAVSVHIADGSSVSFGLGELTLQGGVGATTTVSNQGSGTYSFTISGASTTAQYYSFRNLDSSGIQLTGTPTITTLSDGDVELAVNGGSAMTVASTVIDQNPALQIQRMRIATTTAIGGYNVTESGTPSSYWWFRSHVGNLAGEAFDNDPGGNPGYIRWDDSNYDISISGHVYSDHGTTALGAPVCDGSTQSLRLVVDYGATAYTTSCDGSGAYTFPHVIFIGDVAMTVYLDGVSVRGATIIRTPTASITGLDLYQDAVIVRNEDVLPISIAQLARYDNSDDSDLPFNAATSTTDTLIVQPGAELYVWAGKSFAPGGDVTLDSGGSGSAEDGRLFIGDGATFAASGSESVSLGGGLYVGTSSVFTTGTGSFTFTATTTGKYLYSAIPLTFHDLTFDGAGGGWALANMSVATTTVSHNLALTTGTLSGTGDLVVQAGDLSGGGTVSMTGGLVRLEDTANLGNTNPWQFYDLTLGSTTSNTITKTGIGTTTILHVLTVPSSTTFDAGSAPVVLSGGGTPFVLGGTFTVGTAPFYYTASSATNVADTDYAALSLVPASPGNPTYTILGGTFSANVLDVGGTNPVTLNANTNDPALSLGDISIAAGSTFVASNVGAFDVAGSWTNAGTFTNSSGAVRFTATATGKTLTTGGSSFYDLTFDGAGGGWTLLDNATSTHDAVITDAASFTLSSGKSLAVGGTFTNSVGGAATTWTGSTLYLYSGTGFDINTKADTGDTYDTLLLGGSAKVRMWNSSASTTLVPASASLYSQDHAGVDGSLYLYGAYARSSGSDYWSYATDFDGADISGSPRAVDVRFASGASMTLSGGLLDIIGAPSATTTIRNQGTGSYAFSVSGGTFAAQYYSVRDAGTNGLSFSGSPTITTLSDGDYEVSAPGGSAITIAGTAITANPLKIVQRTRFATTTAISATNVTATGSTASSWKFNIHTGNLAGEAFDSDPGGDPGYIRWDDSASAITIAGNVYADEGTTVSSACDGSSQVVRLKVQGAGTLTSSCSAATGAYAIVGINYNPGDTLTVYLDTNGGPSAATVTVDPVTNIGNMDLYEHRVIVRHEDTSPITIADLAVYDSSDDSDIPFTATDSTTDTLVLPPDTKLIVWNNKTFAPAGDITLNSGGNGDAWDGTLELRDGATFSAAGTQTHALGGSLLLGTGASINPANSSFTFTATTTGKTIDFGPAGLYDAVFDGVGGNWAFSTTSAYVADDLTITAGTLTLPTATTTIGGSFTNAGTFMHNNGQVVFASTATGKTITAGGSSFYDLTFDGAGGGWSFADTNATSSRDVIITNGNVTLPGGIFAVGGSFMNAGIFAAGSGSVRFTAVGAGETITAGGSDFAGLLLDGAGGEWTFTDAFATSTGDFRILQGSTTLPYAQFAVGGSFVNAGTFNTGTTSVKLVANATGKTVTAGGSDFYDLLLDNSAGGWTMTDDATTTRDFTLSHAASFTKTSGTSLGVSGTFTNSVGGAATTWTGSTLFLDSGTAYSLNAKTDAGDTYGTLLLGASTDIRMWGSTATSVTVPGNASLYSQDNAGTDGALYIYGTYARSSGSDYWSYATDFDGAALGSPRAVTVSVASGGAISYQSGASLSVVGGASATTTVTNQGSGTYSFAIAGATLNANYYALRNMDSAGLDISGSPTITSLSNGDLELAVGGGSLITLAGSAIDANASSVFTGMRFATTTAIGGYNVTRTGSPVGAWSFQGATGNLAGEAFDVDGGDDCGSVRWSDSTCLFVSQEHYRWRNDDGGVGAPDSTWYDQSFAKRKSVHIGNPNSTAYTDVPVKLVVDYDSDMRSDFADLRFTDSSGTSLIPYWSESAISSASTTVWVNVPSLPASGQTTIYMYYGSSTATSVSDGSSTFDFFEDFESGSLSGYSGNTSLFTVSTSFAHNHTYGLDAGSNSGQKTTTGIYRTGSLISRGSTIRYYQYVDATQQDEPCTLFGVQGSGQNYAVCLDRYPVDTIGISKNVTSNDDSGTVLATTSVSYTTGWYEVYVDWLTTGTISARVYTSTGSLFGTVSTSDSTYTSAGGMGFTYWFQHGGWDFYSVWPYRASTPTYSFGAEDVSGGATWVAAEDTPFVGASTNTDYRVRFSIQNTGILLSDRTFRLQVAPIGASLNCESVPHVNYTDVPTDTAGCGSATACMKTTTYYADGDPIADLLSYPSSLAFVDGYAVADPSNQTSALSVPSYGATEVEYKLQFTSLALDNAYCLRVADPDSALSNDDLDNYQHVAEAILLHPPFITDLTLNLDTAIALTEGATTTIYASSTISDDNGYADIVTATSTIFREGVGALCTPDENNCYQMVGSACTYSDCSGNSCTLRCRADLQYIADPTDAGSTYESEGWYARLFLEDSTGLTALATSSPVDVLTLYGLSVDTSAIDFGSLAPGDDTGTVNAQTTMINTGNTQIGIQVYGTDLAGNSSSIPVGEQKYATTTFAYGSCSLCQFLTGSATNVDVSPLAKPTATTTPVTTDLYWGINIPTGIDASVHQGTNTFMATAP